MGGLFKKPKAPKQDEQDSKWEPIIGPMTATSSARNGITRGKGSTKPTGLGLGGIPSGGYLLGG